MAIDPETLFVGKIEPSSTEYPFGKARNITSPGDGTGTPFIAALVNDLFGYQQSLLSAAGIAPSGNPDEVGDSQYLDSARKIHGDASNPVPTAKTLDLKVGATVYSTGYTSTNDGGHETYDVVGPTTGTDDGGSFFDMSNGNQLQLRRSNTVDAAAFGLVYGGVIDQTQFDNLIAYCVASEVRAVLSGVFSDVANTTLGIPSNFADLQNAFDFIRDKISHRRETLDVNFETTHAPTGGVTLIGGDFSCVQVVADDALVTVDAAFPAEELFRGENCRMPRLACLVDMNDLGTDGYAVRDGSIGYVKPAAGVKNAGDRGLYANAGRVYANQSIWDGSNDRGCWATRNSFMHVEGASFVGCVKTSAEVSAMTSRRSSKIHAQNAIITGSGTGAVSCIRTSEINLENADLSGCLNGDGIQISNGSSVNARFCTINNSQGIGVDCNDGSTISLLEATVTGSGQENVIVREGSNGTIRSATITGGADGVFVDSASSLTGTDAVITGATGFGVFVTDGATFNCSGGTISGHGTYGIRSIASTVSSNSSTQILNNGTTGVLADNGSTVRLGGATITGNPAGLDVRVTDGSIVSLNGATTSSGAPSLADINGVSAFNTTEANGIIFA